MNILDKIVAHKKTEIEKAKSEVSYAALESSRSFLTRVPFSFKDFLLDADRTGIIAEFKRKSPSKGIINDKVSVARCYHWLCCCRCFGTFGFDRYVSFLWARKPTWYRHAGLNTDPYSAQGFYDRRVPGTGSKSLGRGYYFTDSGHTYALPKFNCWHRGQKVLGLNVLLEVHNLEELQRSINPNLDAIGVNNRNLADFTVSVETSYQLAEHIPADF